MFAQLSGLIRIHNPVDTFRNANTFQGPFHFLLISDKV
jgi:hypothetical protein